MNVVHLHTQLKENIFSLPPPGHSTSHDVSVRPTTTTRFQRDHEHPQIIKRRHPQQDRGPRRHHEQDARQANLAKRAQTPTQGTSSTRQVQPHQRRRHRRRVGDDQIVRNFDAARAGTRRKIVGGLERTCQARVARNTHASHRTTNNQPLDNQ